ncbi:MAG: efflux RND transporter periplasmic adaptor subunit [Terriglobales bacterium]
MIAPSPLPPPQEIPAGPKPRLGRSRHASRNQFVAWAVVIVLLAVLGWYGWQWAVRLSAPAAAAIPTTTVRQGEVELQVFASGYLRGGNPEILAGPSIRGTLTIKSILPDGTPVHKGDVVVTFDTATQEYNLAQAEATLEQAQQSVIEAQATAAAQTESDHYALQKAAFDVQRAQLQVQKNPILDVVDAKKNTLALANAQATLAQLQHDISSRQASNQASIAVQQANERKAEQDAVAAKADIAAMTLTASHAGYVSVQANQSGGIMFAGMQTQTFKVGDTVQHRQDVVEIPNTSTWQVDLNVSELDAGQLAVGEPVAIHFVAYPGRAFPGKIAILGAMTGRPWERQEQVTVQLDPTTVALRPGLTVNGVITTAVLQHVLWVPSAAVFPQGGNSIVYVRHGNGFQQKPVQLVQRSESQVVIQGVPAGTVVALSNPQATAANPAGGAAPAAPGRGGRGGTRGGPAFPGSGSGGGRGPRGGRG